MTLADYLDAIVEVIFLIDIAINFICSYDDPKTGQPVVKLGLIAKNYLSGWFIVDAVAVLPVSLIEAWLSDQDSANVGYTDVSETKLARLARLPRIYKLLRILRLAKMIKIAKSEREMSNYIQSLEISFGVARLMQVLTLQMFLIHLVACLWYFVATLENSIFDTWVGARGIVDADKPYQYFNAFYWAF